MGTGPITQERNMTETMTDEQRRAKLMAFTDIVNNTVTEHGDGVEIDIILEGLAITVAHTISVIASSVDQDKTPKEFALGLADRFYDVVKTNVTRFMDTPPEEVINANTTKPDGEL